MSLACFKKELDDDIHRQRSVFDCFYYQLNGSTLYMKQLSLHQKQDKNVFLLSTVYKSLETFVYGYYPLLYFTLPNKSCVYLCHGSDHCPVGIEIEI